MESTFNGLMEWMSGTNWKASHRNSNCRRFVQIAYLLFCRWVGRFTFPAIAPLTLVTRKRIHFHDSYLHQMVSGPFK